MTVTEFEAERAHLRCKYCGELGTLAPYAKGPHFGVECVACNKQGALAGVQWLSRKAMSEHWAERVEVLR